tara:strand:+ start:300 stop:1187 length:888 start_codon:yes stop_codon:yes gene_type:complete
MDFIKPKITTPHNFLSCGAGVQSSTLALMIAHGEAPMVDAAIFADTQAEPAGLYDWIEKLKGFIADAPKPFPFHVVTKGSLTEEVLKVRTSQGKGAIPEGDTYLRRLIPIFGRDRVTGEKQANVRRACTLQWKIEPVTKKVRSLAGIKRGQKEITVTQMIGISMDEIERLKESREPWTQFRWPLVEMGMTRRDCKEWMKAKGYPEPPRSACYYCPFHDDNEWRRMRDEDPEHFQKAIEFDEELREKEKKHPANRTMDLYIHHSATPLRDADLSTDGDRGQLELDWRSECEGMCGM